MQNNKLLSLLKTFSGNDLLRFEKYINSPFFNENREIVCFYNGIRETCLSNGKTNKSPGKLGVWSAIFPKTPFDDTRFRRLCSDLLKLGMDFLACRRFREEPHFRHLLLLRELQRARLDKHFNGIVRRTEKKLSKSTYRDTDFHYLSYSLLIRKYEYQEYGAKKSTAFKFIEQADYHLDCYYYSKKLQHYSDTLGYQNMLSGSADIHLLPDLIDYLRETPYLEEPSVKAWYFVVLMMLNRDDEHYFQQLKSLVETHGDCFQKKERQTLFIHLMNYCIDTKINNGRSEYYAELFSLYRTALDQRIIYENGHLNPHHYKNIITIALHVKEFSWVLDFIHSYTQELPAVDQDNALNYNLANVFFHTGEYDKVISNLREVEYKSIVYALGSRLLLLRTYFELEEFQALDSMIDSFRIYLRRNKLISKEVKQQYLNVLRFTKKLSLLAPYDEPGLKKVSEQIENCKALAAKKWLLAKVAEKKGRKV